MTGSSGPADLRGSARKAEGARFLVAEGMVVEEADAVRKPLAQRLDRMLTLRFADRDLEQRFVTEHVTSGLSAIRIFLLGACLLYGAFGFLDAYIIADARIVAWAIRYGVVCPFLAAVLLLTYWSGFQRFAQVLLALCVMISGLGIIAMTAVAAAPGNALYYAGLIMVVIYGASLVRLRCVIAAVVSLLLLALYQLSALYINPIPSSLLLNNDFFLTFSVGVGIFASYMQELYARHDFTSAELLRQEKARSDELRTAAEAASKSKSDFLAIMSHELRTPLNAILGFSEIMRLRMFGPVGSERYVSYVDDIFSTAQHLLRVISDILDLSKAELGKLSLYEEEVDLLAVLDQCFRLLRDRAAEQGVRMSLQTDGVDAAVIFADQTLITQVFLNLMGNGIKFTPSPGAVTAAVSRDQDGGVVVQVTDTGIGIAEADLQRVREPFTQVANALTRKHGGAGLGLPLVCRIVELHNGTIRIDSKLGAGTSVTVKLPPERCIARAAQKRGVA
jgi:two-component system cell cycle sensor histidine kinase PleC